MGFAGLRDRSEECGVGNSSGSVKYSIETKKALGPIPGKIAISGNPCPNTRRRRPEYNNMLRHAISRTTRTALISGRRSGLGALSAAPSSVSSILSQRRCFSSDLPDHTVQGMPALSPTMEVGNISWRMQVSGIPQYTRDGPKRVT